MSNLRSNTVQPSSISHIPLNLVFLVRVDSLSPDYTVQRNRAEHHHLNFWVPPDIKEAFNRENGRLFRWQGGRMAVVENNDPVQRTYSQPEFLYRAATVFTQRPDTDHILAVDFDAETRDVRDTPNGWKVLTFDHIPRGRNYTYSSLDLLGVEQHLAAPGSPQWLPQLMPAIYDYQEVNIDGRPDPATTQSAGLIGSLPLLLALAAFSAPRNSLAAAFACVRPGTWQPHQIHSGRNVRERGMVVTIYYDPTEPKHSNKALLDQLQDGAYGPFYR